MFDIIHTYNHEDYSDIRAFPSNDLAANEIDYFKLIVDNKISIEYRGKIVWCSMRIDIDEIPTEVGVEYTKHNNDIKYCTQQAIDKLMLIKQESIDAKLLGQVY